METERFTERIRELDQQVLVERVEVRGFLRFRDKGGSQPWDVRAADERVYVAKFINNPQESGLPPKILTTELICGRLGQLFQPPLAPEVAVLYVPQVLIDAGGLCFSGGQPLQGGDAFGSVACDACHDSKDGGRLDQIPGHLLAPVVLFQTWLDSDDQVALIADDQSWVLSVDHGYYFGSGGWQLNRFQSCAPFDHRLPTGAEAARLRSRELFDSALAQLMSISEEEFVQAFTGFPESWKVPAELRASIAAYLWARRDLVEQALASLWREAA